MKEELIISGRENMLVDPQLHIWHWPISLYLFLGGLAAGILFLFRSSWQKPLLVAVAAVVFIFILTIVQPAILVRVLMDSTLIAGLVWSLKA